MLAALAPCDSSLQVLNDGLCGSTPAAVARYRAWLQIAPPLMLLSGLLLFPAAFSAALAWLLRPRGGAAALLLDEEEEEEED